MRLHRLELEGFGPFRDRQVVDFDAFDDDGVFLITGRTGAGKSSILDGVCFALYGRVPRYGSSDKGLRSDHCAPDDPTEVRLEFSIGDRRLRVTRSPEYDRPKRRGEGTTPVKPRAQLDEFVQGRWVGRASGPRDVGLLLSEVLGLTREQFLQVILLAQGRFAQFLLAGNDERQAVLRTLFGTRRYEDYARALADRRKAAADGVEKAKVALELLLAHGEQLAGAQPLGAEAASIAERVAALAVACDRARHLVETSEAAVEQAQKLRTWAELTLGEGKQTAEAQSDLRTERVRLAELEADAAEIAVARRELADAQAAEALRATIEVDARRSSELLEAQRRSTDARALLAATGYPDADATDAQLQSDVDRWIAQLSAWQEIDQLEKGLPAARDQIAQLTVRIGDLRAERDQIEAELKSAPDRLGELDEQITAASEAAGAEAGLLLRIEEGAAKLAAAHELVAAQQQVERAERVYAAAAERADAAGRAVVVLLQQRLQNHAGELAAELRPGEPCAVCGAVEHPRPAQPPAQPITDAAVAAAEGDRAERREAEARAQQAADAARTRRNELAERSGGATVAHLEESLATLRAQASTAAEQRARRDALTAERAQLDARQTAAMQRRDALSEQIASLSAEHAAQGAAVQASERRVDEARGSASSVAARIAETSALRTSATSVIAALRTLTVTRAAAEEARADLVQRIESSGFADADAAAAALRDEQTRTSLAARVDEHGQKLAATRARLLDLELRMLPEEPVDLAVLQARLDAADRDYRDAVERRARAASTAATLDDVHRRASTQAESVGPLVAEAESIAALADAIGGRGANTHRMTLEAFVLAAELEEIVAQANVRLDDMSSGRYRLVHTDARAARGAASGLGIEVMDAFTGVPRAAASLSGGETFLASLALALGLADVVTARAGGIRLDTLFVDEGFGSLDAETLEIAMNTLETLRHGGRSVGVISHVEAMREQLPAQLRVTAGSHGPSRIEQRATVDAV
ncbi:hypothetical protein LK09_18360 [Microbacterium mangrovi]|uniref:Nuclease SbcCD subunit C n=1 Tax=Microbacterium mangrovi TaxID=1348253 RepID=A0A0B2A1F2_9MICO|nr:SMC family ATPase [Microbacterium mangrovi]KHK95644.1 hypothetical protein LK09_18360 [Microbacterium mangrovi]